MNSAIILAAGKSTRMKSELNKHLHNIKDKPEIFYPIETLQKVAGKIVIVVGYQKELIIEKVNKQFKEIEFAVQEEQLGTGHAVLMAENNFNNITGNVFILPGDAPLVKSKTLKDMESKHNKSKSILTILACKLKNPNSYGRIVINDDNDVEKIVEVKDATTDELKINLINSGIYLVDISFLFKALKNIKNDNKQKEYYLTDIVSLASKEGRVSVFEIHDEKEIIGINTREDLEMVREIIK